MFLFVSGALDLLHSATRLVQTKFQRKEHTNQMAKRCVLFTLFIYIYVKCNKRCSLVNMSSFPRGSRFDQACESCLPLLWLNIEADGFPVTYLRPFKRQHPHHRTFHEIYIHQNTQHGCLRTLYVPFSNRRYYYQINGISFN